MVLLNCAPPASPAQLTFRLMDLSVQIMDGDKYLWQALGSGLWPVMVLVSEIVQVCLCVLCEKEGALGGGCNLQDGCCMLLLHAVALEPCLFLMRSCSTNHMAFSIRTSSSALADLHPR